MAIKYLKIEADYMCFPLWEVYEDGLVNVDPDKMASLSLELKQLLKNWQERYEGTYVEDNPAKSGFANAEDEVDFEEKGFVIWRKMIFEIGFKYDIKFWSLKMQRVCDSIIDYNKQS